MKTLVIVQARYQSTRLRGKILRAINGLPMLYHVIRRVEQLGYPVVVATPDDYPWIPEDNVLSRYCGVALEYPEYDRFIRVTSDCPLWDVGVARWVLSQWQDRWEYVGTSAAWDGLDTEVFSAKALEVADWSETNREHVTRWMRQQSWAWVLPVDTTYRWSVDDIKGLEFVREVYAACVHCAAGVEHHTNAGGSIGGADRHPVWDLHYLPDGGLAECTAYELLMSRTGGPVYESV